MVTVLNIALENHPGSLLEVLEILGRAEINIEAIEAEAQGDFATARLLAAKPQLAAELLRQDGYDVVEAEAIELMVANKHGELARIMARLAKGGINVVSLFGTAPSPGVADGRLLLRVGDIAKAKAILGAS